MKKIELQEISILEYCNMLRSGVDKVEIEQIGTLLTESLGEFGGGFDVALFMLQKDILIFRCKFAIAVLDFDEEKAKILKKKIEQLQKELDKKVKKADKPNPYKSFLSWILAVERYLGFAIEKNNDLLYFSEATKQMLNSYEAQKKQIEDNKVNKKR